MTVVIAKLPASEGGGSCQHIVDEAFFDSAGRVTDFKVNAAWNNAPVNQSCPGASVPPRSTVIYPGVASITKGIANTPTVATADGTTYPSATPVQCCQLHLGAPAPLVLIHIMQA